VKVSLGLSTVDMAATTAERMLDQADQVLYLAKQAGRNRIVSYQAPQSATA
jgi:PleD family two-component response regulator